MRFSRSLLSFAVVSGSLALALQGCGGKSSSLGGSAPGVTAPSSATIGASGGSLASSDGRLELSVPAAALPDGMTITIKPAIVRGAIGVAYAIEPDGAQLAVPMKVMLHYADSDVGLGAPSGLRVGVYAGDHWQALPGYALNASTRTITGTITRLATFGAMAADALCVTRQGDLGCGCSGSGVGGSTGGSSSSGGTGSGSGGGETCAPLTCAGLDPCAGLVGATETSCTVTGSQYTATCCFAPGAPYCVSSKADCNGSSGSSSGSSGSSGSSSSSGAWSSSTGSGGGSGTGSGSGSGGESGSGSGSGGGSGGGSGSSSGGTCALPKCSDLVCPDGTTVSSCTTLPSGYDATCCYAPGVVPPDAPPASSSGSSSGGAWSSSGSGGLGSSGSGSGSCGGGSSSSSGGP